MLQRFTPLSDLGERLERAIDERVMEKRLQQREALFQSQDPSYAGGPTLTSDAAPLPKRTKRASASTEPYFDGKYVG